MLSLWLLLAYPALAPHAEAYSRDAATLVQIIKRYPSDQKAVKAELIQAYADSLKIVWLTMCGLGAVAMFASLATKGLDLNRPLETEHGFLEDRKDGE